MDNDDSHKIVDRLYASLMALDLATIAEQDIEAILSPYVEQMQIDQQAGEPIAARRRLMSLLLALHRFDMAVVAKDSRLPQDTVQVIAEEMIFAWKAGADRDDMAALMAFVEAEVGEWGSRLV